MKYNLIGDNLQLVNLELNENEKVYAETGKFVYKSSNVNIEAKIKGGIGSGIKRLFIGESFFVAEFKPIKGTGIVGFGPDLPGKIKIIKLKSNESFIAERRAFLCAEDKVTLDMQFAKISAGIFGGEGIILQKLSGPGTAFINVCGDIIEYDLKKGEALEVFRGHLVGFEPTVTYDIKYIGNIKTAVFGGAGLMLINMKGPGKVILQSMTRDKLKRELGSVNTGGAARGMNFNNLGRHTGGIIQQ